MSSLEEEATSALHGGAWSDNALEKPLSYTGETSTDLTSSQSEKTHTPTPRVEREKEILSGIGIDKEAFNIICSNVSKYVARQSKMDPKAIVNEVRQLMAKDMDALDKKTTDMVDAKTRLAGGVDIDKRLRRMEEQITILEHKVEAVTKSVGERNAGETSMIRTAHEIITKHARKVHGDETSADLALSDQTGLTEQFENRLDVLGDVMKNILTPTAPLVKTTSDKWKKKINRM